MAKCLFIYGYSLSDAVRFNRIRGRWVKVKLLKRAGKVATYVHYYCTRKSEVRPCNQSIYTSVEKLEEQVDAELAKYTILPEFRDLALEILNRNHKTETSGRTKVYEMQQTKRKQIQGQLDSLVDMRTRNLLDDDEYVSQRVRLKAELTRVDEGLRGTEARADNWLGTTERAFDFAANARAHFRTGDLTTKRDILMTLGSNFLLKDKHLTLQPSEWLVPIAESYSNRSRVLKEGSNQNKNLSPDRRRG